VSAVTTTGESDQALVAECLSGDQQAWIRLLNRYKRLIYSVTLRFSFDVEDRHDVFQAVCLETLKSLPSLRSASSLRYWILTISVRQCYVLLRNRREQRDQEPDEAALAVHDPRADTMQLYLESERAEQLRHAMEELPERCRALLELMFFAEDKNSYTQLGGRFGWSKDSIGSARLRCLERLRRILEDKGF
jgi:RNA polymerase sigma factor (sigma-70 family)